MLSARGKEQASSTVMDGYLRRISEVPYSSVNPQGMVSFANAENFLLADHVLEYVNSKISILPEDLSYHHGPIGPLRLRKAMASHINDYFSPVKPVTGDHVTFVSGLTALADIIATNLLNEGEGMLLGMPFYGAFDRDLTIRSKCKLIYTPFDVNVDQFTPAAVQKYEAALLNAREEGITVRAMMICNPHNPLGKCYPPETLKEILSFCNKYSLHLISDEIYALCVFKNYETKQALPEFTSVLSIDTKDLISPDQVHVMYGMAKDFGLAGLHLGCLITSNSSLTRATRALARYSAPSELSCATAATILDDKPFVNSLIIKSQALLEEHYEYATLICHGFGIEYVRDGNAGFFLWINLEDALDGYGFEAERALQIELWREGAEIASGYAYHAVQPGWFRVIFTMDKDTLGAGLKRISDVLQRHQKATAARTPALGIYGDDL